MIMNYSFRGLVITVLSAAILVSAAGGCGEDTAAGYPLAVEQGSGPPYSLIRPGHDFEPMSMPSIRPDPVRFLDVPILMYHHVGVAPPGADSLRQGLTVSPREFSRQMDYLDQAGYNPITQAQLFQALYFGDALPPKPVLLTFDDGYMDNYQQALPVLTRHNFPATFYIITGNVGDPDYMGWQQIIDLDWLGMDIGAHTVNHRDLTLIAPAEARDEIEQSAIALYEHLGHPVYWLSYPAGKFDDNARTVAWQAGFLLATTTIRGEIQNSNAPYVLHRYRVEASTAFEEFVRLLQ